MVVVVDGDDNDDDDVIIAVAVIAIVTSSDLMRKMFLVSRNFIFALGSFQHSAFSQRTTSTCF